MAYTQNRHETMTKKWALAALVALGAMSCESRQSACNKEIEKCVEGFSDAYFNYDLAKALEFCTPESRKWIEFLASNIGEADLEVLNAQEKRAQAEVKDIIYNIGDTAGTAIVEVGDYLQMDTIGHTMRLVDESTFTLDFVYKDSKCRIRMAGLLRNGTSDRG